jgi:hypothetical protein
MQEINLPTTLKKGVNVNETFTPFFNFPIEYLKYRVITTFLSNVVWSKLCCFYQ